MKRLFTFVFAAILALGSLHAEIYYGNCGFQRTGFNVRWLLDTETGTLTLEGFGAMKNYKFITDEAPWFEERLYIKHVIIKDGVTIIGTWAFNQCFFLEDITLGKDVCIVPSDFCCNNIRLQTIKVSNKNEYFTAKDGILYDKKRTVLLHFPAGHPAKAYTLPKSLEKIAAFAFSGNENLETLTIPSLKSIEEHAFSDCCNLKRINCYPIEPPVLEGTAVWHVRLNPVVYVPAKSMELYKATLWKHMLLKPLKK